MCVCTCAHVLSALENTIGWKQFSAAEMIWEHEEFGITICNIWNGNFDCTGVWMKAKGRGHVCKICVWRPAHSLKCVCFLNSLISYSFCHLPLSPRNQGQRVHCSFSPTRDEWLVVASQYPSVALNPLVLGFSPSSDWATLFACLSFCWKLSQATDSLEFLLDFQLSESH